MDVKFVKVADNKNAISTYKLLTTVNEMPMNMMIKLIGVRLPFNIQKYNSNYYLNVELFKSDTNYDDNINKINSFENLVKSKFSDNLTEKQFISAIKTRSNEHVHIKLMCKKNKNSIIIDTVDKRDNYNAIDLSNLKESHIDNDCRYDVVVKPEYLWQSEDNSNITFGLNFFVVKIQYNKS
jgi:hypothetical protein